MLNTYPLACAGLQAVCVHAEMAMFDVLKQMKGFKDVSWDIALDGQNPHIVGVALKAQQDAENVDVVRPSARIKQRRKKAVKSGFAAS